MQYINASVRGDAFSEQKAKSDADVLRSRGATMSSDQTTPATNALQRYYTSDSTVKTALQTKNVNDLNQVIVKAKNDYQWAQAHGDQAGMLAAKYLADNMRKMGGTISSDASLADAIRIANAPSPKPAPVTPPTPAVPTAPVATEEDKSLLSKAWDGIQSFLGFKEISDGWDKLIAPESTWDQRLKGAMSIIGNGALDLTYFTGGGEMKAAESLVKAATEYGKEYMAKTTAKQAEIIAAKNALPNLEKAVIDPRKLTEYALNPEHPVGGNKAKVFESTLGYNQSNAESLMSQIKSKLKQSEAVEGTTDQYGKRYTVDMLITGPNGNSKVVRTGWICKTGSDVPELTTLYVK